jgi:hypothetical protein
MKGPSFGGHGDAKEGAAFFTIVSWSSSSLCSVRKAIEHELLVLLRKSRRLLADRRGYKRDALLTAQESGRLGRRRRACHSLDRAATPEQAGTACLH